MLTHTDLQEGKPENVAAEVSLPGASEPCIFTWTCAFSHNLFFQFLFSLLILCVLIFSHYSICAFDSSIKFVALHIFLNLEKMRG
jgi:hypothetical protein